MLKPKDREKVEMYLEKGRKILLEKLEESLVAGQPPKSLTVTFVMPDTNNEMQMRYVCPRGTGERHSVQLGAVRRGTDRLVSNYMKLGDVQEVRAYLQRTDLGPEWLGSLQHLSDSVDDFWD